MCTAKAATPESVIPRRLSLPRSVMPSPACVPTHDTVRHSHFRCIHSRRGVAWDSEPPCAPCSPSRMPPYLDTIPLRNQPPYPLLSIRDRAVACKYDMAQGLVRPCTEYRVLCSLHASRFRQPRIGPGPRIPATPTRPGAGTTGRGSQRGDNHADVGDDGPVCRRLGGPISTL